MSQQVLLSLHNSSTPLIIVKVFLLVYHVLFPTISRLYSHFQAYLNPLYNYVVKSRKLQYGGMAQQGRVIVLCFKRNQREIDCVRSSVGEFAASGAEGVEKKKFLISDRSILAE